MQCGADLWTVTPGSLYVMVLTQVLVTEKCQLR